MGNCPNRVSWTILHISHEARETLKGGREECCEMVVQTEELTVVALGKPPSLCLGEDFMASDLPRPKNKSHGSQRGLWRKGERGKKMPEFSLYASMT